ncbi:ARM repeat-containing protein [Neoconidiobolus thromboides FSU 785]|nr:ARM repeat-containing protein [Neoconidiobolus thromboides FSU 785]
MVQLIPDKIKENANLQLSLLNGVEEGSINNKMEALKTIKNEVIGNRTKKNLYVQIGLIPKIIQIIYTKEEESMSVIIQAVIVLGSLAYGSPEIVNELVQHKAIASLVGCIDLNKYPLELIEAASRSLKALLQHSKVDSGLIYKDPNLKNIISLLEINDLDIDIEKKQIPTLHTAELAALILAKSCDTNDRQNQLKSRDVIPLLINLLQSNSTKAKEAALLALSALCKKNIDVGRWALTIQSTGPVPTVDLLLSFVRSMSPSIQLAAASCLTNLLRSKALEDKNSEVALILIPTLVKLLEANGSVKIEAPLILSELVAEDEKLQKTACDLDAITKLSEAISKLSEYKQNINNFFYYQPKDKDLFEENSLIALASIGSLTEECREAIIEAKCMPRIIDAISHPKTGVRAAACQCVRSLSRSVRYLRTELMDAGLFKPLFKLLDDEDITVKSVAVSTLCNVVLKFSPMKTDIVQNGGIEKLVALVDASDKELSLNAIWALKNLIFKSDPSVKRSLMSILAYSRLEEFILNGLPDVQEQTLGLVRNLSCGEEPDLDELINGMGSKRLVSLLEKKLESNFTNIKIQTMFCVVNISTGNKEHKSFIMNSGSILTSVRSALNHANQQVRVAAIWVVINLSWIDDNQEECFQRIRKLKAMGFERLLENLAKDNSLDVKDRARTALSHFKAEAQHAFGNRNIGFENQRRSIIRDQHNRDNFLDDEGPFDR